MTIKEAITLVKECGFNIETMKHSECEKVVLNALEKQIPKKPTLKIFEDVDEETNEKYYPQYYLCAVCGEHIGCKYNGYCSYCGQALDWSDGK